MAMKGLDVAKGWEEKGIYRQDTEHFQGNKTTLYAIILVTMCHYTFVKIHRMYKTKNTNANYGLWVILMC